MQPLDFLTLVWGVQEGFVFLPRKAKRWVEQEAFRWPDDRAKIEAYIETYKDKADLYYTPNLFAQPDRRREFVQPPRYLYADLDAVNPNQAGVRPHLVVQSSPGRFQGLWRLARPLDPLKHESYNQRLTYAIGADKGGWDLTQVLRIPSTRNLKYPGNVQVRLAWNEPGHSTLAKVKRYLDGVETNREALGPIVPPDLRLPSETAAQITKRVRDHIDQRTKELLFAKTTDTAGAEGRSGRLWELECRLLEIGLMPEEVFVVVKDTVWNKFGDRRDGDLILWREVQKAHLHIGTIVTKPVSLDHTRSALRTVRPVLLSYADILGSAIREPDWAIEEWWTLGSHGILAGLPKSFKSLVATDMAISLASETPFLGEFKVNPKAVGPVLIVQQENSLALMRDRLIKISHSRGLQTGTVSVDPTALTFRSPPSLPILFYNDFGFDMTMPDDREAIEEVIRNNGVKTVMFDPLYLMIGGADENVAKEIRPVLQWLLRIRNLYGIQVVVVHHWGKGQNNQGGRGTGGLKLLGSTTIYGWLEAGIYLEAKHNTGTVQVVVEREFRERPSAPPLAFNLDMADVGELGYEWTPIGAVGSSNNLINYIADQVDGATLPGIRVAMEWGQKKTRSEVDNLIEEGIIVEEKQGRVSRFFLRAGYEE